MGRFDSREFNRASGEKNLLRGEEMPPLTRDNITPEELYLRCLGDTEQKLREQSARVLLGGIEDKSEEYLPYVFHYEDAVVHAQLSNTSITKICDAPPMLDFLLSPEGQKYRHNHRPRSALYKQSRAAIEIGDQTLAADFTIVAGFHDFNAADKWQRRIEKYREWAEKKPIDKKGERLKRLQEGLEEDAFAFHIDLTVDNGRWHLSHINIRKPHEDNRLLHLTYGEHPRDRFAKKLRRQWSDLHKKSPDYAHARAAFYTEVRDFVDQETRRVNLLYDVLTEVGL